VRDLASIQHEASKIERWRLADSLSGQLARRAGQLEVARMLGIDIETELPLVRQTLAISSSAGCGSELALYTFCDTEPSADAPLLLFSHGGSIQAQPGCRSFRRRSIIVAPAATWPSSTTASPTGSSIFESPTHGCSSASAGVRVRSR
jgi:hypothetical protein